MKVNLVLGDEGAVRSGYVNLDLTIQQPEGTRFPAHPDDFGTLVSPNEADEICAVGIIDKIPGDSVAHVLTYWASRLAHNGQLTVSALDVQDFAEHLLANEMGIRDVDAVLYSRRSAHTMQSLVASLEALGLRVVRKFWQDLNAFVVAVRP